MLTGQNGILQRAGEAKVTMDEQEEAEKIQLSYMAEKTNQLGKAVQANGLQDEIGQYGEAEVFDNGDGTFYVIYKDSGNCYLVDKNGNATKKDKSDVVSGVFAIIYDDGTMAFNTTGNTIEGKTVLYKTGDISQTKFETNDDVLWKDHLEKIKTVTFEEEVKPMYTRKWFYHCTNLTQITEIENLSTKNVKDMLHMFNGCSKLASINVSNFDTKNVTNMCAMFSRCSKLTSLNVNNFNTKNVTTMRCMFQHCGELTTLDVSNFDTSKVTDMSCMFGCGINTSTSNLQEIKGLENFDTRNVTNMEGMFVHQTKLKELNLSSFDTRNVTNMNFMFEATNIEKIYISSKWDISKVTESPRMFGGKTYVSDGRTFTYAGVNDPLKLTGGNGTNWDPEHIDKEYARIDTAVYDADGNYVSGDKGYFSVLQ